MKSIIYAVLAVCLSMPAFAQDVTCEASAAEKKLAGAAKTSHIKKCTTDAKTACEASAKEKQLAGASSYEPCEEVHR